MPSEKPKRYLTFNQLRERWGNCSAMFVERKLKSDPSFPKPMRLSGARLRLFDEDDVERYERASVRKR
jgi:hypothetical protein